MGMKPEVKHSVWCNLAHIITSTTLNGDFESFGQRAAVYDETVITNPIDMKDKIWKYLSMTGMEFTYSFVTWIWLLVVLIVEGQIFSLVIYVHNMFSIVNDNANENISVHSAENVCRMHS